MLSKSCKEIIPVLELSFCLQEANKAGFIGFMRIFNASSKDASSDGVNTSQFGVFEESFDSMEL